MPKIFITVHNDKETNECKEDIGLVKTGKVSWQHNGNCPPFNTPQFVQDGIRKFTCTLKGIEYSKDVNITANTQYVRIRVSAGAVVFDAI